MKKKITDLFNNVRSVNEKMLYNMQKITILNKNNIYIQNYSEILEIGEEKIQLKELSIIGKNLKIVKMSKYYIEIIGDIHDLHFGDDRNEG
ncbi:YabP/YqfC family sporulation protein [Haloplasma contractile]|uniref:YabP domain containing protein n=1 Tax=Haloplasma contractile SSD-17B TaxID=1033810 RepID=U2E072_9MOLU|nr:YabP/YqfC family sporulation protein [Haloplasma contractile]ERJ13827.1 YabP domain containing protein [Haloplasma contractile SSD-17B]